MSETSAGGNRGKALADMQHTFTQTGYVDLKGLAVYSSCSVRWLRMRLAERSRPLPCYRIGGKVLVKIEEFDRWMSAYRVEAQPDELDELVDAIVAQVSA